MADRNFAEMILGELDDVQEDLINLYEDIHQEGDMRDAAARRATLATLSEFNEKLEAFEAASDEMRALIERVTGVARRDAASNSLTTQPGYVEGPRGHSPSENFTHFHVAGYAFLGEVYVVKTWGALYEQLLRKLAERDPEQFQALPDTPPFNGQDYNHKFTRAAADHPRAVRELPYGVYCKGTMGVEVMFVNIRRLLMYFDIPESELVVYLREEWKGD